MLLCTVTSFSCCVWSNRGDVCWGLLWVISILGNSWGIISTTQRLYSWFICFWLSKSNLWLQNFIWASSFHVKENNSNYVNLVFCSSGPMTIVATQCCAGRGIYPSHSTVGSGIQHSSFANVFLSSVNFIYLIHDACPLCSSLMLAHRVMCVYIYICIYINRTVTSIALSTLQLGHNFKVYARMQAQHCRLLGV